MIDIERLEEKDVGRWVEYRSRGRDKFEIGKIKSWNDLYVFVVYLCNDDWNNFKNYTGCATDPDDLNFQRKVGEND